MANRYNPYKRSKYGAKKTEVDGIVFDSKHEAERYCELKMLERAGEISNLGLQKPFLLLPTAYKTVPRYGKKGQRLADKEVVRFRQVVYIADFVYLDKNGNVVVEDAKGVRTPEYKLKQKMMWYFHKIEIKEV